MPQPDKRFSSGGVTATLWTNQAVRDGKTSAYTTVSFDKRYKDKEGAWKSTNSLNATDLPKAIMVLSKAFEHIALKPEASQEAPKA